MDGELSFLEQGSDKFAGSKFERVPFTRPEG